MNGLIDWTMSRARMIMALVILSVAAGWSAYTSLPKEGSPNIDIPIIYVSVSYPGVSALDAERLIVRPLETRLRTLEGLKTLTGVASEGHASVVLEFDFGFDKDAIIAKVREEVDRAKAEFPADAKDPTVSEVNTSAFPILVVAITGEVPERELLRRAKEVRTAAESVPSVLEAAMNGQREELLEVIIDPAKMEAYAVSPAELYALVNNNNRIIAAGSIDSGAGAFSVKLPGAIESAQDAFGLPVKVSGDRVVTLGDIASVNRTFDDRTSYARVNGRPAITLNVKKRAGENIISTVADVRARIAQLQETWPDSVRSAVTVSYSIDESARVQNMVSQLEASVITAICLVMIVVLGALGVRSALLVGFSIPTSFLLAFALLAALGMTVNNMVMFGLILAVGMLVDGGIVVVEYADQRQSEGASPEAAYGEAAKRMFWPIVSSTATTLCAFLPLLFWPGMPGQFMRYLPITLIFVLTASLLVALIYLPVAGAIVGWIVSRVGRPFAKKPKATVYAPPRRRLGIYGFVLNLIVKNPIAPVLVVAGAVGLMIFSLNLFKANNLGVEFFVKTDPEVANLYISARGNLSIEEKDKLAREVEKRVLTIPELSTVYTVVGAGAGANQKAVGGSGGPSDSIASIQVELLDWHQRKSGAEVLDDIRAAVAGIPGIYTDLREQAQGPQQGKPIQIELSGPNLDGLADAATKLTAHLRDIEGLRDIDNTLPLPGIEWTLKVDRTEAGKYGADIASVGVLVQLVTRGAVLGAYRPDDSDEEIQIRARFPEKYRVISTLDELRAPTRQGLTPIANFVTREAAPKLSEITRKGGMRIFTVRADVEPGVDVNKKVKEIESWLSEAGLPGVKHKFVGDQEEQAEAQAFLAKAFAGALGLMFIILMAQFNSLYNSVLVLSAVVLSVGGVLMGMVVMGQPFSIIMTGIGIVSLAGIVVNNNIVLIDTYQELSRDMPRLDAIVETGVRRLRPVFLTTITTIAGLLPMMFAVSVDVIDQDLSVGAPSALWWTQLATAIVFGLGVATLLTLVVTPALLAIRVWVEAALRIGLRLAARATGLQSRRMREVWRLRKAVRRFEGPLIWESAQQQRFDDGFAETVTPVQDAPAAPLGAAEDDIRGFAPPLRMDAAGAAPEAQPTPRAAE